DFVKEYLDIYSQNHLNDELGFHVGGFENGKPKLFHVFWPYNKPPRQEPKAVRRSDHSEVGWLLYNGRNDLANRAISTLNNEVFSRGETRLNTQTLIGRILMCDFIARFAAEITPQVGPPFEINLIFPNNSIKSIVNRSLAPLSLDTASSILPDI